MVLGLVIHLTIPALQLSVLNRWFLTDVNIQHYKLKTFYYVVWHLFHYAKGFDSEFIIINFVECST